MNVLLVDAHHAEAGQLADLLRRQGHEVTVTQNGKDAIQHLVRQSPDVVISTVAATDIDGFVLTQEILRLAAPRWLPVILMSAERDETLQIRAIEVGADSFFVKPVSPAALAVRLDAIERLLRLQQDAGSRLVEIHRYVAAEEEDLRIARHLIEYQMSPEGARLLDDPAICYWQQTCRRIGGDMLLVGRTPSGVLHVLLADASGSGLSAYVTLQPIIAPFLRMTEKGFVLSAIVRELNRKVCQSLPPGRVLAAQLASIDTRNGVLGVWNGNMPPAFMLDAAAHQCQKFGLTHAALGTLDDESFDDRVYMHALSPDEQLVMVSDGLLNAIGPNGEHFGEQRLADALVSQPRGQCCDTVIAALQSHLAATPARDDMTIVMIDCEKGMAEIAASPAAQAQARQTGNWCFTLQLAAAELRHTDVVPLLMGVANQFSSVRNLSGALFVVLSELFNNALDHGLLRLDSKIKHAPDGMETWLQVRAKRLAELAEGEIRLWVEQLDEGGKCWLRIRCEDSGPGFDLQTTLGQARQRLAGAHPCTLPSGRGLALVESFAHAIEIGPQGNDVTVLLAIDSSVAPVH